MAKKKPKRKKRPKKKPPSLGERYVAAMRGVSRSYVETTLFDPRNDTGLVEGGLRVQSLTGSELQVLYTSSGSPLLHEVFKRSVN